mgnify:CR=1 FL=1
MIPLSVSLHTTSPGCGDGARARFAAPFGKAPLLLGGRQEPQERHPRAGAEGLGVDLLQDEDQRRELAVRQAAPSASPRPRGARRRRRRSCPRPPAPSARSAAPRSRGAPLRSALRPSRARRRTRGDRRRDLRPRRSARRPGRRTRTGCRAGRESDHDAPARCSRAWLRAVARRSRRSPAFSGSRRSGRGRVVEPADGAHHACGRHAAEEAVALDERGARARRARPPPAAASPAAPPPTTTTS